MKVIVSGASGYIGTHFLRSLIEDGLKPGAITRASNSTIPYVDSSKVEVYSADITRPLNITLRDKYDVFVHFAAANDIDSANPETALIATTLGTKYCLDFCKRNGIKKFIYFSTFQVLGLSDGFINEDTVPEPKNDYGITHLFAEEYVKMYRLTSNIEYIIIRPTNIYGAPLGKNIDRWTLVPNCFCKEAYEEGKIQLNSSGKQKRNFLNLKDIIDVTNILLKKFGEFKNSVINLSSENNYTILEIAELVKSVYREKFNKDCELVIKSNEPQESNQYTIERKIVSKLDYQFSDRNAILTEISATFDKLTNKN